MPRCELYLSVDNIELEFENAITNGAKLISPILDRDWGDKVCYFSDPDGHVIAFAEKIRENNLKYGFMTDIKRPLIVFLANSVPFGVLFFLLGHYFKLELQVWFYIVIALFYGLMAVFLRPRFISFLNKKFNQH